MDTAMVRDQVGIRNLLIKFRQEKRHSGWRQSIQNQIFSITSIP